jgi:general secretion pathway protein D
MSAKTYNNRNFGFGASKRILWRLVNPFILAVTLLLASSYLLAAEDGTVVVEPRYSVFALKHISVEQAKKFLADAKLGTVSQLPASNMILVTAQPRQLSKASAILKLVDTETPFVMKAILPASSAGNLPLNEQIAARVGNISIGTFSIPPSGVGKAKAIIDVHEDSVVAIAPADQIEKIIGVIGKDDFEGDIKQPQEVKVEVLRPAQLHKLLEPSQKEEPKADRHADAKLERLKRELEQLKGGKSQKDETSESGQAGTDSDDSEPNVLFQNLLDSLAEAEKKAAELAQPVAMPEPNEPAPQTITDVTVPEKSVQKEPPVPVKPVAEKIVAKPKPVQKTTPDKVAIEVEEPNQVAIIVEEEPNAVTQVAEPNAASPVYQPELTSLGDEELELDLPPKINVIDLLDLVGKYLGLDYMYDPADMTGLKGEVTLKIQKSIKVKELYPLAESVLKFKKFVMTRKENLVTIVPVIRSADIDAPIVGPLKPGVKEGDVIITRVFELKHIDTTSAENLLKGMNLGISFSPIPDVGTLIISGYAYRMARIEELLDMIDKPGEQKKFKFRPLEYTTAKTLATKVQTLAEQLGTISITVAAPTPSTTTVRRPTPTRPGQRTPTPSRAPTRPTTPPATPAKPTVYLDADERTNRILMIGLEEQLAVVDKLIDTLDVEQQDLRTLRLYEIQHVDAEEVRIKLEELGIISAGRGVSGRTSTRTTTTGRTPTTTTGRPPTGRAPTTRPSTSAATATIEEPLVEEPQVVIIEPTNSLLVNATAEQHVRIAMIIGYVDSSQEETANPYVVYPLENQDPEELAGVLEKLIQETITEQSGADSKVVRTTTTRRKIEEDIFIVPDPKTYSLIVYASKKNQQWIRSLIEELDQYRPQVLLDVTLVAVSKNDEFTLDLNLISSFPDLVSTSGLTGIISGTGESAITSSDILGKLNGRDRFIDMQSNSGDGTAFYGDKHINVLLTAIQTKGYGRVLARPKLLVNDNEMGTIKSQETTYISRTKVSYRKGAGGTGNLEDIPVIDTTFEPYEAGISMDIEPHISKGDQLRLKITMSRTDFRDTAASTRAVDPTPPDKVTSEVTTVVTVPDAHTVILGGLEKIDQSKGGSKVPLIGDLPIVGGLFRSTANKDEQSRLYVFVKAHILRPGEEFTRESDIEVVSLKNRATFEKYEKEMQGYEDWPGIKPTPMDPMQILEAD